MQPTIPGILILENNKSFGRTANKKHLYYRCVASNKDYPIFLVPFDVKVGFSKIYINKYVLFAPTDAERNGQYAIGKLIETLGNVDSLDAFYEYNLHAKGIYATNAKIPREVLAAPKYAEYLAQITRKFAHEDRCDQHVFTVDPANTTDFDDALGVVQLSDHEVKISVYIANVYAWLDTLDLWQYVASSPRVASIYLPNKRISMLPRVLSECCSLTQDNQRFSMAFDFVVDTHTGTIVQTTVVNAIINVRTNYVYGSTDLLNTPDYVKIAQCTSQIAKTPVDSRQFPALRGAEFPALRESVMTPLQGAEFPALRESVMTPLQGAELVAYWMIKANGYCATQLRNNRAEGVFIELPPPVWENVPTASHDYYSRSSEAAAKYAHVTSPLRRIVDIINQSFLHGSDRFVTGLEDRIAAINVAKRSIRKVQNNCKLMNYCFNNDAIIGQVFKGVVVEALSDNTYSVYLEHMQVYYKFKTELSLELNTTRNFNIYLFAKKNQMISKIKLHLCE